MNPFEIAPYLGDELIINSEFLGFRLNKDWRRVAFKNQQGNVIGYGILPTGLRVLADSQEANSFKIDDEIVYDPQGFIQRSDSASFLDIKPNDPFPLVERGDVLKIASITLTYNPDNQEEYNKGKLSIELFDAASQQNIYILPAIIESTNILQTSDNYILKLDRDFRGQKYVYYSEYTDTWLKIIRLESNDIVDLKLEINLGKEGSGIHVDPYFGLTWTEVVKRLLRCRPDFPARTPHVANLKVNNANSFSFGGQCENLTSEDIAVYGPAPSSNKQFQQDFFLYRLPPVQITPEGLSFYGIYIPRDKKVITSSGSETGPVAVLIPLKNFSITQDDLGQYILPDNADNAEIIKPENILNLEVPSYTESEIKKLPLPDPRLIQQKPAPSSRPIRDITKLKIITNTNIIDYFEFIQLNQKVTYNIEFFQSAPRGKWLLYAPTGKLMATSNLPPILPYTLSAMDIDRIRGVNFRDQVEKIGLSASPFGTWKLQYEVDNYFDFVTIEVSQRGGPREILEDASTTKSFWNIRQIAGKTSKKIGELNGTSIPLQIVDKSKVDDIFWYKVIPKKDITQKESKDKEDIISAGTNCWVTHEGVEGVVPWNLFLQQLRRFEEQNRTLSLDNRITKLRQLAHKEDLPFDDIIGVPEGQEYLDTRIFLRSEWQILENSLQKVRVPDGSIVDIYHLMVGLDVLPKPIEEQTYLGFNIGQNYSAATWSGDIGAGAADALIGKDKTWEGKKNIPSRGKDARINYLSKLQNRYYSTRAPESDLFGDIDAWGVNNLRSDQSLNSIEKLLLSYYNKNKITTSRKTSIKLFLNHYGFTTNTPISPRLISQPATATMFKQIKLFAKIWIIRHQVFELDPFLYSDQDLNQWYVSPMTDRFLNWLEDLAKSYGVLVTTI